MLLLCGWVVPSQIPIIISIIIIIVVLVVVHKAVARVWASALIYVERTAAAAMKERVWSEPPRNINDQGHYGSAANMQRMNVIARQFFIVEHETRLCQRGLPRERTPHSWKSPPEVKEYFWKMTVPPLFGAGIWKSGLGFLLGCSVWHWVGIFCGRSLFSKWVLCDGPNKGPICAGNGVNTGGLV